MIEQLTHSWLCWAIVLLALACYQQLLLDYLDHGSQPESLDNNAGQQLGEYAQREFTGVLISALPLLGLLGTIIGLLECFAGIASEGASGELVSGGIADALLTTQLGLVCAIPGWLLQSWVHSLRKSRQSAPPELAR